MISRREKEAIRKFAVRLGRNLVGAALIILLIWVGLSLAEVPMPTFRPNQPQMLDMDEPG